MSLLIIFVFLGIAVLGMPLAVALGIGAVAGLIHSDVDFNLLPTRMMNAVNAFPLMTIPFFILAGELMMNAGIMERLIDLANSVVGRVRGGLAHVTVLAGITGSASGGMSIALAAMSDTFIAAAEAAKIPLEVLHRVASMASGGMDTLPHNGAVITLLAVTGLTHRVAYKDIFVITIIKTSAVFVVIGVYYLTGIY